MNSPGITMPLRKVAHLSLVVISHAAASAIMRASLASSEGSKRTPVCGSLNQRRVAD